MWSEAALIATMLFGSTAGHGHPVPSLSFAPDTQQAGRAVVIHIRGARAWDGRCDLSRIRVLAEDGEQLHHSAFAQLADAGWQATDLARAPDRQRVEMSARIRKRLAEGAGFMEAREYDDYLRFAVELTGEGLGAGQVAVLLEPDGCHPILPGSRGHGRHSNEIAVTLRVMRGTPAGRYVIEFPVETFCGSLPALSGTLVVTSP